MITPVATPIAPMPAGWRFVQPQARRLELSEGDWILVKKRLTAGERHEHYARQYSLVDDKLVPNVRMRSGLSMILAYLLEWNLTDAAGRVVPLQTLDGQDPITVTAAALEALDPESYDEVHQAIKRHELEMIAEREAEKKTRRGAPASSETWRSPDDTIGRTRPSPALTPTFTP